MDVRNMIFQSSGMSEISFRNVTLHVIEGDAWVFSNGSNVVIHAGQDFPIGTGQGDVTIRALYTNQRVSYTFSDN